MMGFEMKFKEQTLLLPSEAIITVTRRKIKEEEEMRVYVGAYDPITQNSIVWLRSELMLWDEILINIKNVKNTTEPVDIYNFFESLNTTKQDSDKKTLDRYLMLKKELEEKNLI